MVLKTAHFITLAAFIAGCGGAPASDESTHVETAETTHRAPAPTSSNAASMPSETSAPPSPSEPCRVVVSPTTVSFGRANNLTLDQLRASASSFATAHQDEPAGPSCLVAPAPETAYARMVEVMDILVQAGIPNLSLAVDPPHSSESDR